MVERGKRRVPDVGSSQAPRAVRLAGLWDYWRDPDGRELYAFTIITTGLTPLFGPFTTECPYLRQRNGSAVG
jgi:putative SOS response-associated peptidase YedK